LEIFKSFSCKIRKTDVLAISAFITPSTYNETIINKTYRPLSLAKILVAENNVGTN